MHFLRRTADRPRHRASVRAMAWSASARLNPAAPLQLVLSIGNNRVSGIHAA